MENRLTLQQLVAFIQLCESGGFRDAAVALGVSQPALSRMIQQIEGRLDNRLFDRDTRKAHLTPAGECLYPLARRVVREYEKAFAEFDEFATGGRGAVCISALPSLAAMLLPGVVACFRRRHPDVALKVREDIGGPLYQGIRDRVTDIGLAPPPQGSDDLSYRPLLRDELVLVCRRDDPAARADAHGWSILAEREFITTSRETGLRAMIDHALQEAGVQAEPLMSARQPATVGSLVDAKVGIGVLSRLTLAQLNSATLVGVPLRGPVVARSLGMITHIGRSLSPAARLIQAEIEKQAASLTALLNTPQRV